MPTRESFFIPGATRTRMLPSGAKVGNLLFSSGIDGMDPDTGELGRDLQEQATICFRNLRTFVEMAGGSPENIIRVHVLMGNPAEREAVNKPWLEMFPNEDSRPARRVIKYDPPPDLFLQLEVVAVID
jgi:2-iminobutanoate/2-iminopropanoate deaminase